MNINKAYIFKLSCEGLSDKQIALRLGITENRVKSIINDYMPK